MTYLIRSLWCISTSTMPVIWSLMHVIHHMTVLQCPPSVCNKKGDMAHTIALPIMVLAFALCCRLYCLACFVNSHTFVSSSNLSHFWLMQGQSLTTVMTYCTYLIPQPMLRISNNWYPSWCQQTVENLPYLLLQPMLAGSRKSVWFQQAQEHPNLLRIKGDMVKTICPICFDHISLIPGEMWMFLGLSDSLMSANVCQHGIIHRLLDMVITYRTLKLLTQTSYLDFLCCKNVWVILGLVNFYFSTLMGIDYF